jgi:serine/threonine protein kinase/tetratricopeptide (TPR) repeat protein
MPLSTGTKLGPYEILALVGAGGMGEVYRARDPRLDRVVAIKVSGAQFSERFEREAKTIAALNHPNICQVYDVGPDYLVMEFIEGAPLSGPLNPDVALRYAVQIADALSAAHAKGITHRDLKPANVLVTASGIKLLDFGLALLSRDANGAGAAAGSTATIGMTQAGTILGTAAYMSPEQAEAKAVDARSDVFSFGLVFYEMLSGRRAFPGDSAIAIMAAILHKEPAPLPLAPALQHILDRSLRKSPADRFQSMALVKEALLAAISGISSHATAALPHLEAPSSPVDRTPSIAVLPFANMSRDSDDEYFSDGLAEEIINALTQVPELKVIARTSAFAFKGKNEDIRKIAETLGVSSVLEGSVRRAGARIRVTAQLIRAEDGSHLWSQRYESEMTDVFAIQDEISAAIVQQLRLNLMGHSLLKRAATNVAAYEATLEGRYHLTQYTPAAIERGRQCFERAIALDPQYAPAYAGLADFHIWQAAVGSAPTLQALPLGRQAALRALELDPQLAEAHALLGQICAALDYDWGAAEQHYLRAIASNPAAAAVRFTYAYWCLRPTGRLAEALSEAERALELDPLSQSYGVVRAYLLSFAGRYEEAVKVARRSFDMNPSHSLAQFVLSYVLACQGRSEEAVDLAERALQIHGRYPLSLAWVGGVLAMTGHRDAARGIVAELEAMAGATSSVAGPLTVVNSALGNLDEAFRWADRAIDQRDQQVIGLKTTPFFENLRSDPRYPALLQRMSLTPSLSQ